MFKTKAILVAVCTACFAFTPTVATAQTHHGVWFGLGGGPGFASIACDNCGNGSDREAAPVGVFRIGINLTDRVLVGGEFNLWRHEYGFGESTEALNLYHAMAAVTFYPRATGFFVRGGIGGAFSNVTTDAPGTTTTMDIGRGLALMASAGYDVRFARRWSVTPAVGFSYGRLGDSEFNGEALGHFRQNVVDFTISITFR